MAIQSTSIRPIVRPAARPAVAPRAAQPMKAQGVLQTGGKVAGGAYGGFLGFGAGTIGAIFFGAEKIMRSTGGPWVIPVMGLMVAAGTALGAFTGSKIMGAIGSKVEEIVKK